MAVSEHRRSAPSRVACAVVTISDTRTIATDTSGAAIETLLGGGGHDVVSRTLVRDEPDEIRGELDRLLDLAPVQAVITTGGTGITARDSTYEVVSAMLEKRIDGFGELFRMLSYADVGPAAMMSRACAGLARGRILIALPGSEAAVRLAVEKLIVPELGHMVREAGR